jgi:hypothetical protein
MIPATVNVLEQCLNDNDEENASKIFEVFDTLLMLVSLWIKKKYWCWGHNIEFVFFIGRSSLVKPFG